MIYKINRIELNEKLIVVEAFTVFCLVGNDKQDACPTWFSGSDMLGVCRILAGVCLEPPWCLLDTFPMVCGYPFGGVDFVGCECKINWIKGLKVIQCFGKGK